MPLREYRCRECGAVWEFLQRKNEKPKVCSICGKGKPEQLVSLCAFAVRNNRVASRFRDEMAKGEEIRQELREEHGVEQVTPMGRNTLRDVMNDVKQQGSFVRDRMQETQEKNGKKRKEKQRDWMKKALKRTPKRKAERDEMMAKEAAEKRRITVSGCH